MATRSVQPRTVFLDDGGVLNDNRRRGPQWARLIGEFMPARLGGTSEQWAEANRSIFRQVEAELTRQLPSFPSYQAFYQTYATSWLNRMCAAIGIQSPPDEAAVVLYRELSIAASRQVSAAIPDAADAVRALHQAGYRLYTASGTPSWELHGILAGMELGDLVVECYGPDLIDTVKFGSVYYERIFAHAGIRPDEALVIESDAECCRWATEAGATAVWIDADRGDARTLKEILDRRQNLI